MTTRPAAVAGRFYPEDPDELRAMLGAMLNEVEAGTVSEAMGPKVLIAPHAGYVYSGPVAASAYGMLRGRAAEIRRVIVLGPSHRVAFRGIALPGVDALATPLGIVPVDAEAVAAVTGMEQVVVNRQAHADEHSIEVHLPFLQMMLDEFAVLPLVVGNAEANEVAEVMERVWGGPETLIVISSDLSHYLPYADACKIDAATAQAIVELRGPLSHEQACGGTPINGLLAVAGRRQLTAKLLDLRNSGDTAGSRDQVVGYGAFAFAEPESKAWGAERGAAMLSLARQAIERQLGKVIVPMVEPAWCQQRGATFVTLTRDGQLRGCMGQLEARRPLGRDLEANALAAAFNDPRFAPVDLREWPQVAVEVSLLSPQCPLVFASEGDALAQLRPGIDGIVFDYGKYRSTFLPQVWEILPDPAQFMGQLKRKAGLPESCWSPDIKLFRYTVEKWKESPLQ